LGNAVMRALLDWGARQGARHVYLQVAEDNTPALELYRRLGIGLHHRYHYRLQPGN
jgi:ribosomal protein S18 acetylase RimI-like enzyme